MKKAIFGLLLLSIFLFSCKKEENEIKSPISHPAKSDPSEDLLKFEDETEFMQTLHQTSSYDLTERTTWENSKSFVSLGRSNDEFYETIDETSFTDFADIEAFVNSNRDKIRLEPDGSGEYYLQTVLFKQPLRYFANRDAMFQIGDKVYLVLEDGLVFTSINNIKTLKEINNSNYLNYINNLEFKFSSNLISTNEGSRDNTYNCGVFHENKVTNDRNRTVLQIQMFATFVYNGINEYVYYEVKPWHKTCGIWFGCKRHISCNIKVAADHYVYINNYGWKRVNGSYSCTNKYASKVSGTMCDEWIAFSTTVNPIGHFGGYDCWGDTPSTNPNAVLQANTFLCP